MLTFGLIALLGMAQADTPKKKTDKTEESKTTKKSSNSKSSSKTSSTKKVTKPAPKKTTTKAPSTSKSTNTKAVPKKAPNKPPPKQTTQKSPPKPTGKTKTTASPAKQRTGKEQSQGNAHKPIGAQSSSNTNRPSYNRAPNNVDRPQVGNEQSHTPNAHTPIGNSGGHRGPTYERAPDNVNRPSVGKEQDNAPTAHEPIGGRTTRPEKDRPSREPEGRIDREPPTKKESNRPEKGRPSRNQETSNTPNKNIDRTGPDSEPCGGCPSQAVSPGKSQQRNAYNGGYNTSTRRTRTTQPQSGADEMGAWGFGLGTLSFASDYVDGGAYNDGGLGMSLGLRLIPQFEIEGSYGHYTDSTLESSRNRLNRPVQLVGQVHPFPDAVVSPFVSGGYVWNNIIIDDEYIADGENKTAKQEGWLTGLALGAGVTFNVHQNIALELDGRLFQYNNLEYWDDVGDTATLVSMGVVVGF
jgi:opacity protein-like surface antigen